MTATIWMGKLGYTGVFISSVGILPAEVVIVMVGANKPDKLVQIALATAFGEIVGGLITYAFGYYFRNKDILKFLRGRGKFLNISEKAFEKGKKDITKKGFIYLMLTRFTPGLRVLTLIVAGYLEYNVLSASIAILIGTFVYAYGFAYLGAEIGFNWFEIKGILDTINSILTFLTALAIALIIYKNRKKVKRFVKKIIGRE